MKCERSETIRIERVYHEKLHLRCYDVFRYAVLDADAGRRGLFRFLPAGSVHDLHSMLQPVRISRMRLRWSLRHRRRWREGRRWNRFRSGRWRGMFARSRFGIVLRSVSRHFRNRLRTVLTALPAASISSRRQLLAITTATPDHVVSY